MVNAPERRMLFSVLRFAVALMAMVRHGGLWLVGM